MSYVKETTTRVWLLEESDDGTTWCATGDLAFRSYAGEQSWEKDGVRYRWTEYVPKKADDEARPPLFLGFRLLAVAQEIANVACGAAVSEEQRHQLAVAKLGVQRIGAELLGAERTR